MGWCGIMLRRQFIKRLFAGACFVVAAIYAPSVAIPAEASPFLEYRAFSVEEVARWFNVPPNLLASMPRWHLLAAGGYV